MPAKSKKQQRLMAMVYAYQTRGGDAPESVKTIARSMAPEDAKHYAQTKHDGLPDKKAIMLDADIPDVVKKAVFHSMTRNDQLKILSEILFNG